MPAIPFLLLGFSLLAFTVGFLSHFLGLDAARPDLLIIGTVYFTVLWRFPVGLFAGLYGALLIAAQSAAPFSMVVLVAVLVYSAIKLMSVRLMLRHPVHLAFIAAFACLPVNLLKAGLLTLFIPDAYPEMPGWFIPALWSAMATLLMALPAYVAGKWVERRFAAGKANTAYLP